MSLGGYINPRAPGVHDIPLYQMTRHFKFSRRFVSSLWSPLQCSNVSVLSVSGQTRISFLRLGKKVQGCPGTLEGQFGNGSFGFCVAVNWVPQSDIHALSKKYIMAGQLFPGITTPLGCERIVCFNFASTPGWTGVRMGKGFVHSNVTAGLLFGRASSPG